MRISDWSSDVCSSDLEQVVERLGAIAGNDHRIADVVLAEGPQRERLVVRIVFDQPNRLLEHVRPRSEGEVEGGALAYLAGRPQAPENGRAPCRERVCQYVEISVVAVSLKKKNKQT